MRAVYNIRMHTYVDMQRAKPLNYAPTQTIPNQTLSELVVNNMHHMLRDTMSCDIIPLPMKQDLQLVRPCQQISQQHKPPVNWPWMCWHGFRDAIIYTWLPYCHYLQVRNHWDTASIPTSYCTSLTAQGGTAEVFNL